MCAGLHLDLGPRVMGATDFEMRHPSLLDKLHDFTLSLYRDPTFFHSYTV